MKVKLPRLTEDEARKTITSEPSLKTAHLKGRKYYAVKLLYSGPSSYRTWLSILRSQFGTSKKVFEVWAETERGFINGSGWDGNGVRKC